jgi:hypothetical protein
MLFCFGGNILVFIVCSLFLFLVFFFVYSYSHFPLLHSKITYVLVRSHNGGGT